MTLTSLQLILFSLKKKNSHFLFKIRTVSLNDFLKGVFFFKSAFSGWNVCQSRHLCSSYSPPDEPGWRQTVCSSGGQTGCSWTSLTFSQHVYISSVYKMYLCLIVSQGGYNLTSLPQSVCQTVQTLLGDPAPSPGSLEGPCRRSVKGLFLFRMSVFHDCGDDIFCL